jgi:SAM-dependent methyltransferase
VLAEVQNDYARRLVRRRQSVRPEPAVSSELHQRVEGHYTRADLGTRILEALQAAGKDTAQLHPDDLALIDEFHVRGRAATLDLARAAGIESTHHVLDVGSGIGGPARCLAHEFGCRVTGVDLTAEYCRVATLLTERTRLSALVTFQQADAMHLPFADGAFDVVWTAHVAMNIADKPGLYRELHRVLKDGGTLAIYDVLAGPSGPILFPVPWAHGPETSFVVTPEELRTLLEQAGFTIADWADTTAAARAWMAALADSVRKHGPPALGVHLLFGPEFRAMGQNQRRNLEEGRIVLAQVVARK